MSKLLRWLSAATLCSLVAAPVSVFAQSEPLLSIDKKKYKSVAPVEYGLHYEEIGMIGEGTLHAELVRNRSFEEANSPEGLKMLNDLYYEMPAPTGKNKKIVKVDELIGWQSFPISYSPIFLSRTKSDAMSDVNRHSMLVNVSAEIKDYSDAMILNEGYFGMNLVKGLRYDLSMFALNRNYSSSVNVMLVDEYGKQASDVVKVDINSKEWTKSECSLVATRDVKRGMLAIQPTKAGSFQLDVVSMFPSNTWDDGKSIFRADIIENLKDYTPSFIRFPGGCIVHGTNVETMYHWKKTIGPIENRPGQWSKWAPYYRTDGLGYHEFYELCEYVGADAMYVMPTGLVCTGWVKNEGSLWEHAHPDTDVNYYIQDALDAIEYAIGSVDTKWGAMRAENGHPEPFPLKYVEIGNEDFGSEYWERYDIIYRALSAKYPDLIYIANSVISAYEDKRGDIEKFLDPSIIDVFDEHYYKDLDWASEYHYKFDEYERGVADLFIGELGIGGRYPTNQLGTAAVRMALERNSDMNAMLAERPVMRHWDFTEHTGTQMMLINGVDCSVKTAMFYISKLFRDNRFDTYIDSRVTGFDGAQDIFVTMGYDSASKEYILKLINIRDKDVALKTDIKSFKKTVKATKTLLDLSSGEHNTPDTPDVVKPEVSEVKLALDGDITVEGSSMVVYRFK